MRFGRVATPQGLIFAVIDGDVVKGIEGTPFTAPQFTGAQWPTDEVRILAPMLPSKIVCPGLVVKPPTTVIGPGAAIKVPGPVQASAGLAVVVSRPCKSVASARGHMLGCAPAVNVAGVYDTFFPMGPWIDTDSIVSEVTVQLNDATFTAPVENVEEAFVSASAVMTLLPGDVIFVPSGSAHDLHPGAQVTVQWGDARLSNTVELD